MYVDTRKRKDGSVLICITYIDPKTRKRARLPRDRHPPFSTVEEAERWIKTQDAALHASRQRSLEKVRWREKFYKFEEYIDQFEAWVLKRAPNDNGSARQRLQHYVFPYFLETKLSNNINQWRYFHAEFRTFLDDEAISIRFNKKLSYSYKNHVINTLNQFTEFMVQHNHMDSEARVVCAHFPQHLLGSRSAEDILPPEEFDDVHKRLVRIDVDVSEFFYVKRHTGMRFNELWSLPASALHAGKIEGPLGEALEAASIEYHGYIFLESQGTPNRDKDKNGRWIRKPLKGRKSIDMKSSRIIPIMDKECWNILARRYKACKKREVETVPGLKFPKLIVDLTQTLFFESCNKSQLEDTLRELYVMLEYKKKVFHCLRHTFITYLVGRTRSYFIARAITGIRSIKVFDMYNHIFELINMRAKAKKQVIDEIA